jgi:membrane fusion protein, multidrug efflux system
MRKVSMMIGFLGGAAVATLITFYAVEGSGKTSNEKARAAPTQPVDNALSVPVRRVVSRTVPIFLDYVGTTEAIRTVTLQAKVTGYLARQAVSDGADVKHGDLLYVLDQRDYQAALEQSKAQAARDSAALDYARARQGRNAE